MVSRNLKQTCLLQREKRVHKDKFLIHKTEKKWLLMSCGARAQPRSNIHFSPHIKAERTRPRLRNSKHTGKQSFLGHMKIIQYSSGHSSPMLCELHLRGSSVHGRSNPSEVCSKQRTKQTTQPENIKTTNLE